jgi:hypothetical protein
MALILCGPAMLAQEMPRASKEQIKGAAEVKTEQLKGMVVFVEGSQLLVKMASGELRTFKVPPSRRFIVDGKETKINELRPGTTLTATVTTATTPLTERTTTVGSGTVWYVQGNTVVVTLPNGENRMYTVNDAYRFIVNGHDASVHDLRKGMSLSATRIVEEPRTEVTSDIVVTGQAPPAAHK